MAVVGTLEIQMLADIARLQSDMNKVQGTIARTAKNIESTMGSAFGKINSMFATFGVGLSVAGFTTMIKGSIDAMDKLRDLSKTTDIAVETLSGLQLAAKQSGSDLSGVAQSINKLSMNIGKDSEKFRALGITAKEPLEAFKQLSDVFVSITDPQLRAAVAAEALGKSWQTAAPLLSEGSARIGEMVERGMRLSGVTKELADASDEFNDKWAALTGTGGLLTRTVAPLLPLLNTLADDLLESQEKAHGLDSGFNVLLETMRALVVFGGNVSFTFRTIGADLGAMAAQAAALARGDFASISFIGRERVAEAAEARKAFDEWEQGILAVGTAADKTKKTVADMDDALAGTFGRMSAESERRARAFVKEAKAEGTKADAVAALILELKKQLDAVQALDNESADYNKLVREITEGTKKWTQEQVAHALALQGEIDDIKRLKKETEDWAKQYKIAQDMKRDAMKEEAEAIARMSDARRDFINASQESIDQSREEIQLAELEVSMMGETADARREAIALLRAEFDERRRIANAIRSGANITAEDQEWAMRNARETSRNRERADSMRNAANDQLKTQVDMWQSIDNTAHQTFVSILDSGKNTFERLRDTLKNTLFDLLYQMTIKRWIINIAASIGGAGVAQSAFGSTGGGLASLLGGGAGGGGGIMDIMNLGGIAQKIGGFFSGGAGTAATGAALASNIASATSLGVSEGLITAVSEFGGSLATGAGGAAVAANAAAAGGTAAGLTLAQAVPIIGTVAAIAYTLWSSRSKKISAQSTGDMARLYGPQGMTQEWQGQFGTGAGGDQIDALYRRFNTLATQLGATFDQIGFGLGSNTGKQGQNPMIGLRAYAGGGGAENVIFSSGEVPAAQMEIQASRAIFAALKASNLPDYLAKFFNTLAPEFMDQAQIDAALQFAGALKQLRDQLTETRQPLEIARDNVKLMAAALNTTAMTADEWKTGILAAIDAGIGPEALAQWQALGQAIDAVNAIVAEAGAMQTALVDRFSTEAERTARAQQQVTDAFAEYGLVAPTTRAEIAGLVSALDKSNPLHQEYLRVLTALSDALDLAIPEIDAAKDSTDKLTKARELEMRKMELLGDEAGILAARRADERDAVKVLDPALLSLIEEIWDLEDAATAAAKAAASTNAWRGLEIRRLTALGDEAGALAMAREDEWDAIKKLDPSLLGLLETVWSLEDAATAAEAAQKKIDKATDALNAAYEREINEKQSLIDRMGGYVESLRAYRMQLTFNDPSLSPEARYFGTQQRFQSVSQRAALGDMAAMEELQGVSQDFLEASRFYFASGTGFQNDLQSVIAALQTSEDVASRTVTNEQAQLDRLTEQRDLLFGINETLLTVNDAVVNLRSAIMASGNSNSEGNVAILGKLDQVVGAVSEVQTEIRRAA